MTQRDRQASAGVSEAPPRPAHDQAPPAENGAHRGGCAIGPVWEDIYRAAAPAERARLLSLADAQGLIFGHQLPPMETRPARDEVRSFFTQLLGGKLGDLEAVRAPALDEPQLESAQAAAIANALTTPDICLIQGLPVTGKSRVAAEIVIRSAARGERVLLAAPNAASVDRTLALVHNADGLCVVRCLAREENPDSLPSLSRSLLFSERVRGLHARASEAAERQIREAAQLGEALKRDSSLWPHLLELAERHEQLAEQSAALARQCEEVPATIEAAAARVLVSLDRDEAAAGTAFTTADHHLEASILAGARTLTRTLARIDTALRELGQRQDQQKERLATLCAEQDRLAPLVEAKAGRKWWKAAWWQTFFKGDIAGMAADLANQVRDVRASLTALEAEASGLSSERRQADEQARLERAQCIEREVARRRGELGDREAALSQERRLLEKKWHDALAQLHPETVRPGSQTVQVVREARAGWQRALEAAEKHRGFAEEWAASLRDGQAPLAEKLRGCFNLLALPSVDLATDEHFGDAAAHLPVTFDLLVLEHAEQVAEAELLALARRCRRWVLVAESESAGQVRDLPTSWPGGERHTRTPRSDGRRSKAVGVSVFQRLWNQLHCDPSRLPYVWVREADSRLCCRLRPLSLEQRRWIESERVADYPEIELRIVAPPRATRAATSDSFLAEVVFPTAMPIEEAKAYIFRELQELPVRACARSLRLGELPDRFVLHLTEEVEAADKISSLDLTSGVREVLATRANGDGPDRDGWVTRAVEFDRAAGWERRRVDEWIQRHLGVSDLGRTALLNAPCGLAPGLALFLADLLADSGYRPPGSLPVIESNHAPAAAVEFVPVPSLSRSPNRAEPRRARLPNGEGLEVDVADGRHRDRLPSDWHAALGDARGFVNFLEAQAVVRYLARLVGQLQSQAVARSARADNGAHAPPHKPTPLSIGVAALYPAQAKLIRHLLDRSPEVVACPHVQVRVDVPAAFEECEFSQVLVSLTRSHKHRATSFGDGPAALTLALTRGRAKLVLFGDVGTLARRIEWQGTVDHLAEAASARERAIISRLVCYIQGHGQHGRLFHVRSDAPNATAGSRSSVNRGIAAREGSNA